MIYLTHLGRRTMWNYGDCLPSVSSTHLNEPAHRVFPKKMEDWDVARITTEYAYAAERTQAGGMDGIELEAYGHLLDQY
jgi:2,4-dienoyl-CoA reductase-like NADH-dependent reductase (Old Yellow Enzyme family)